MTKLSTLFLTALTVATRCVVAQDVFNGGAYLPPAAAQAMSAMSASFAQYVHYTPTPVPGDGPGVNMQVKSKTKTKTSATPTPTASCSYWLDDIKHQGVAAFNPDSSSMYYTIENCMNITNLTV